MTPAYLIRSEREKRGMTRRQLAEGICSMSLIAQYELGYLLPSHAKMEVLSEQLGVDTAYFKLVVDANRKLHAAVMKLSRAGNYGQAGPLFTRLAQLEPTPSIRARYEYHARECVKSMLTPLQ